MNNMNIPGFTAEISLYKKSDQYLTTISSARTQGIVMPAQFGEMPAPDGPDITIPGLTDMPIPLPRRKICFYPCQRICLPSLGIPCFYPCKQICIWV